MTPEPEPSHTDIPIRSNDDLLNVLDTLLEGSSVNSPWWDRFFADRTRAVPFFVDLPDETLVRDFERNAIQPGRVLELGCGNGRNAMYMASRGCAVDAVDFSEAAIAWGKENAHAAGHDVHYIHGSIYELDVAPATYDIIYDSGCFHHVPPHRRAAYLQLVSTALRTGGILSIICFTAEGGSGLTDLHVYEQRTLKGGLGFSGDQLRHLFAPEFDLVELRRMNEMLAADELYGKDFLQAVRFVKR